jgi:hypothetical protein
MKNLLSELKRWSLGTESAIAGRIDVATRSRRTVRKAPRARVALERLETRDLMSGLMGPTPIFLPPAVLGATPISPTEVSLSWQDLVTGGAVYVNEQSGTGAWTTVAGPMGDGYAYTVTGLSPDSAYNFYVGISGKTYGPVNGNDWYVINGTTSNVAPATTFFPLVGSPTLTATPASSTAMNLSWSGVTGAQQYSVSWWQNPGGQVQTTVVSPGSSHCQLPGLSPFTSYSFQVTAEDGVNTSSASNVSIASTLPASPTLTAATAVSATQINLSWTGVTGASDYLIYNVVKSTQTRMANAGTSLSDSLTGLSPYTTYQLEVGAIGPWGISWSSVRPVTTLPTSPVLSATPTSASQINLSWSSVSSTSDYVVYENTGSGFKEYGDAGTGKSFSATNLSANSTYSFKVADIGPWGVTWSNVVSPLTLPSAPSPGAMAVSASQINVVWGFVAAASYQLDVNESGVWKQVVSLPESSSLYVYVASATGLNADTTYQIKVGATNASGTTWSSALSALTFPAAPTASATTLSVSEIEVGWNPVAGASSYEVEENVSGTWQEVQPVVTGLLPHTTYQFRVGATNASGTSWSNVVSATTLSLKEGKPTPETASGSSMMALAGTSEPGSTGSASGTSSDIVIALGAGMGAPVSKRSNVVTVTT